MTEQLYLIITEDDQILQRGLTMFEAENALCRHINLGAENAFIGDETQTPLGGRTHKNPELCRCESDNYRIDCGCAFGQCEKGLIY